MENPIDKYWQLKKKAQDKLDKARKEYDKEVAILCKELEKAQKKCKHVSDNGWLYSFCTKCDEQLD